MRVFLELSWLFYARLATESCVPKYKQTVSFYINSIFTSSLIRYPRGILTTACPAFTPVSDPYPAPIIEKEDKRTFFRKIAELIHPAPNSRADLIGVFADAEDNQLIGPEARVMLEGVLGMANLTAGDIMVAAPRMDVLNIDAPYEAWLRTVIDTAHSRFPVYSGSKENIIGILLTKDLLKLQASPDLNVRSLLRPASFIPESKNLHDLLRYFRSNRNHQAIVIDEFGRVAGLVTIEDVLEEIVGEIEDEFDLGEEEGSIFSLVDKTYRVSGDTPIERVEEVFAVQLSALNPEDEFDTIGGLIAHEMGHVPKRGEHFVCAGLDFAVLHTKGGAVRWFKVSPHKPSATD